MRHRNSGNIATIVYCSSNQPITFYGLFRNAFLLVIVVLLAAIIAKSSTLAPTDNNKLLGTPCYACLVDNTSYTTTNSHSTSDSTSCFAAVVHLHRHNNYNAFAHSNLFALLPSSIAWQGITQYDRPRCPCLHTLSVTILSFSLIVPCLVAGT